MRTPPPGHAGAGVPRHVIDDDDTDETVLEVDEDDVEEIDSGAVTAVNRLYVESTHLCTECCREVTGIPVTEPPSLDDLRLPVYWRGCVYSGPGELPCWWFCCRGGRADARPGTNGGILGVTGAYVVRVERMVTLA